MHFKEVINVAKIPPQEYKGWIEYVKYIIPGLSLCFILGAISKWIDDNVIPSDFFIVNYVLIAIVFGLIIRNALSLPKIIFPGIEFATKICLFIGIVLLGARLNLVEIFSVGSSAILMVAISITMCIVICGMLAKKLQYNERWGHLVGTGIGVCGVSAVIALAPAIKANSREILAAIGAALLTDMLVLIILPTIAHPLNWNDTLVGFIAGVVPSNTAQCVAIGHAYSDPAGAVATIVKSARNAFMPVVILVMTFYYTKKGLPVGENVRISLLWIRFPKFIVGLLIAAAMNTFGFLTPEAISKAGVLSNWFFVICFVGIGAGIKLNELGKQDLAVIAFGFLMTALLFIYAFLYSKFIILL